MSKTSKIVKKVKEWWMDEADPTPVEVPLDLKRPETMDEKIKRIISTELSIKAMDLGEESFEESNDFELDDEDDMPVSPYEMVDMDPVYPERPPELPGNTSGGDRATPPETNEGDENAGKTDKNDPKSSDNEGNRSH